VTGEEEEEEEEEGQFLRLGRVAGVVMPKKLG